MLPRGTAAKILFSHHDIPLFHLLDKVLVNILHTVRRQLTVGGSIQITSGDNNVCIHVIPIFMYGTFCIHITRSFLHSTAGSVR